MKLNKIALLAATMVATLGYGVSASANVVDLFDDPAAIGVNFVSDYNSAAGPVSQQYDGTAGNTILGGYRDLIIDALVGAAGAPGAGGRGASMSVDGGALHYSNDDGVQSEAAVQWDGDDSADVAGLNIGGLSGANLVFQEGCGSAGCDRFIATVNHADLGFNYDIGVYTDATHYSILRSGTLFEVSAYTSDWLFSWFTDLGEGDFVEDGLPFSIEWGSGGAADFQNVGAIELKLYNTGTCYQSGAPCPVSVDLNIDSITKAVPEPSVLALLGLGLFGLGIMRRKAA